MRPGACPRAGQRGRTGPPQRRAVRRWDGGAQPGLPAGVRTAPHRHRRGARAHPARHRRRRFGHCGRARARFPQHEPASPLHRGVAGAAARGTRCRPPKHLRQHHRDDPSAWLRVEEGLLAGAGVHGVRHGGPDGAALRPPGRLCADRPHGGRPRRDRERRARCGALADGVLLRRQASAHVRGGGRLALPRFRRPASRHRRGADQQHSHRHRRRG